MMTEMNWMMIPAGKRAQVPGLPTFTRPRKPKKRGLALTPAVKKSIAADQKWKCAICKHTLTARFEIHHIKPRARGGRNNRKNLQALCNLCHGKKTDDDITRRRK